MGNVEPVLSTIRVLIGTFRGIFLRDIGKILIVLYAKQIVSRDPVPGQNALSR